MELRHIAIPFYSGIWAWRYDGDDDDAILYVIINMDYAIFLFWNQFCMYIRKHLVA